MNKASAPDGETSPKVFVSYSRRDLAFAERLIGELITSGFEAYLDKKDILPGEPWQDRLGALIAGADTIVFLISPDSIASMHCNWEADEAVRLAKRILPVVYRTVPDEQVPGRIRRLNYIFMREADDYVAALDKLATALNVDIDWIRKHTWLTEQAMHWRNVRSGGDDGLLQGSEIADAELWISSRPAATMEPTELQRAFIKASREAEAARAQKEREQIARTRRFQKRASWALAGVGVLMLAGLGGIIWQDIATDKREAVVFLNPVDQAIREHRYDRAMRYALQTLPPVGAMPWAPVSSAIEGKLGGAALLNRLSFATTGHSAPLNSAAFSPDGARFVITSKDSTARLWDVATGRETAVLRGHTGEVWSAEFNPEGTRIVTASPDKSARVWDVSTGKELVVFAGHSEGVKSAHFSPDGQRVVTASGDRTVRIWETATGKQLSVQKAPDRFKHLWNAQFSPDGTHVVSAWDNGALLWDTVAESEPVHIPGNFVKDVGFSPDGASILTASQMGGAGLWDVATGKATVLGAGAAGLLTCAAFSPDGKLIVTCSGNGARIWDATTGKEKAVLEGHGVKVQCAAFSRDGKRVVTASENESGFTIPVSVGGDLRDYVTSPKASSGISDARVWDVATGKELFVLRGHTAPISHVEFSRDGTWILTASDDGTARVWLTAGIKGVTGILNGHSSWVQGGAFSPDGTKIVTASVDGTARVWDASTSKELAQLVGHAGAGIDGGVMTAEFSPDGTRVVTAAADKTARIWDAATGKELAVLRGHEKILVMASFSPDGSRIVTASGDKTVRLWSAESGEQLFVFKEHPGRPRAAFSPDGSRVLTVGSGSGISAPGSARLWNARTGQEVRALPIDVGGLLTISFSSDGRRLLAAYVNKPARMWDAETGALVAVINGYLVTGAAFSPNGERIVTASVDKTARLWDAQSGEELATLAGHRDRVASAQFSRDGSTVVTTSKDGVALVWDVSQVTLMAGQTLREHICADVLTGVQEFTQAEISDPFLRAVDRDDPVARNPCLRRGPLSIEYYAQAAQRLWRYGMSYIRVQTGSSASATASTK